MNSLRYIASIVLLVSVTMLASCEKHAPSDLHRITIQNNSQSNICPFIPESEILRTGDTSLPNVKPQLQVAAAGSTTHFDLSTDWGDAFRSAGVDTVYFFFIDTDVYNNTSWLQIRDNYMILKRVHYSIAQLEAANWVVRYP